MDGQPGEPRGMYCLDCSYDLRGLRGRACPECGRGFDAGDAKTFSPRAFSPEGRKRVRAVDGCLSVLGLVFSIVLAIAIIWFVLMSIIVLVS